MIEDKVFVDTNIILYAYDRDAAKKYQIASKLVKNLWHSGLGVLSEEIGDTVSRFDIREINLLPSFVLTPTIAG